jgi:hypothetical protein
VCSQYSKKVPAGTRPQILERYYVKPFKGIVERLFGLSKEASKDSTRLRLYLSIWNSENYADVFTEKPYLLSNLDERYLNRLYESYEQHLYEFRDGLYKEAPDLFSRNTEASDSTVAMLKDLIDLI